MQSSSYLWVDGQDWFVLMWRWSRSNSVTSVKRVKKFETRRASRAPIIRLLSALLAVKESAWICVAVPLMFCFPIEGLITQESLTFYNLSKDDLSCVFISNTILSSKPYSIFFFNCIRYPAPNLMDSTIHLLLWFRREKSVHFSIYKYDL